MWTSCWPARPSAATSGNLVYAAVGRAARHRLPRRRHHPSRQRRPRSGAARWFVLAGVAAIVLAAVVAVTLGRRLTRPLREADAAAHRIAVRRASTRGCRSRQPSQNDELADLVRSINSMADALERSQGLEQQFLLSVSHDLRTPLTSIRGYAEAITDGATKDPQWAAGVIQSEANRLERLVRDLLDLAKLQARSFSLQIATARPRAAITTMAVEGFGPDAADVGGSRCRADAPQPVTVQGDRRPPRAGGRQPRRERPEVRPLGGDRSSCRRRRRRRRC